MVSASLTLVIPFYTTTPHYFLTSGIQGEGDSSPFGTQKYFCDIYAAEACVLPQLHSTSALNFGMVSILLWKVFQTLWTTFFAAVGVKP